MKYSASEERYIYKNRDDNETCVTHYYNSDEWTEYYNGILRERDEKLKILKKLDTLLAKWTNFSAIKIGDGPSEALVQKTVEKKSFYYVAQDSDKPTKYFRIGNKWRWCQGIEKGLIYMFGEDNASYKKLTKKWKTLPDGKNVYTYKQIPNKSTKARSFFCKEEDFNEGNLVYINLVKKEEVSEEIVYVKAYVEKKCLVGFSYEETSNECYYKKKNSHKNLFFQGALLPVFIHLWIFRLQLCLKSIKFIRKSRYCFSNHTTFNADYIPFIPAKMGRNYSQSLLGRSGNYMITLLILSSVALA